MWDQLFGASGTYGCMASFPTDADYDPDIADAFEAGGDSEVADGSAVVGGSVGGSDASGG